LADWDSPLLAHQMLTSPHHHRMTTSGSIKSILAIDIS